MTTEPIVRDQEITREFTIERVNRMAHIERLYDFDHDPEPVTVKATNPETGEVVAHFHMDEQGAVTDLQPQPDHPLTAAALGLSVPDDETPGVMVITADDLAAAADDLADEPVVEGKDYPNGMTLGALLVLARDLDESGMATNAAIRAWTRPDGTVTRLAAVHT